MDASQRTHRPHLRGATGALALLLCICGALATSLAVTPRAQATPLSEKQAQAAELSEAVSKIEHEYDDLQEAWRGATIELDQIQADVAETRLELKQTRRELRGAQDRLQNRATAIYRDGGDSSDLLEIAKAGSISDFFERLDMVKRIGDQDVDILGAIRVINKRIAKQERSLERAEERQQRTVRKADKAKKKMAKLLAERQAKLSSVNAEIRLIMEAQRRAAAARAAREAKAEAEGFDATADSGSASSDSSSSSGISVPLPPGSSVAAAAASAAMSKIGTPYVWAGSGPDSFDCSGLVMWAFAQAGRPGLPHSSYALAGMGVDVPLDQLQTGDLVFGSGNGHVGIYVGSGSFVHAPNSGDVVKVTSMSDYSVSHARRI